MPRDRGRQDSNQDPSKIRRGSRRVGDSSKGGEPEADPNAGKTGFSEDGQYFFGPSPTRKREMRHNKEERRGIDPIKDLDLNAGPRNAPKQVGQNVRLIDLAMDDQMFRPPDSDDKDKDDRGGSPKLPPFKKTNDSNRGSEGATPRASRAFAGRKSGRRFSNVVGEGSVRTRSLPGAPKSAPTPPPTPLPKGPGPKTKKVTAPPRRSEGEGRGPKSRPGQRPKRPRAGPAPSGAPGKVTPQGNPRPTAARPGGRPSRPSGSRPRPGPKGPGPTGLKRPSRPSGQRPRPQ